MNLEWMIYLADVSGNLQNAFIVLGVIILMCTPLLTMAIADFSKDKKLWPSFLFGFLGISLIIVGALLPNKTTIYSIAAIKMGKEISKNEKVLETSDKIYKILNQKLDEILEEKK